MPSNVALENEAFAYIEGKATFKQGSKTVGEQYLPARMQPLNDALTALADTVVFTAPGFKPYAVPVTALYEGDNNVMLIESTNLWVPVVLGITAAIIIFRN